ncbi:MAG: iron ABC transporter permease [Thermoplasmata archaeon]|jgi:iron complex transport system permease protein|nr:iron ABC transporter permease [Thermoplasmata archaeon]
MPEENRVMSGIRAVLNGKGETHIAKKKHLSKMMLLIGFILLMTMFVAALCIGPDGIMSPIDAFSNLFSAIGKGGTDMTNDEVRVYSSRMPRAIAAIAVGLGLSIAGAGYQAVIRNPLVDPYIMGVSSGAGTFAIASIAYGFTFFGLVSAHSPFLIAASAIVGGLLAFVATMVLAHMAGASTNAYVLSGVVIGLIFGAIQTVMILFSGHAVSNTMLWLFGSFSQITMRETLCVLIPAVILSVFIMRYSKELNLVLLGDDQARQMGLNVKRFNAMILILSSVLAAFCVAFCGIIGFVGLIIPHLCRMIFGGDHRIVLPASIAFGGAIMIGADLLARMIMPGLELPVGSITTLIGVPVFAYLLYKRGKIYNG